VTLFVDGDRGGDLILKEMLQVAEVEFIARATPGREVEEISQKEIHKALRSREQITPAMVNNATSASNSRARSSSGAKPVRRRAAEAEYDWSRAAKSLDDGARKLFGGMVDDLIGTRGAYLLDEKNGILGKVPVAELQRTLNSIDGVSAVVLDGMLTKKLAEIANNRGVKTLVGSKRVGINRPPEGMLILTGEDFQ